MARKKPAVLKSTLLVRKGEAEPSVFSPSFQPVNGRAGGPSSPALPAEELAAKDLESLVVRRVESATAMDRIKNAMSGDATYPFPVAKARPRDPTDPPSTPGKGRPKRPLSGEAIAVGPAPRSPKANRRKAFTLRLDPRRHLRLRVFSVYTDRSAQDIVTVALDDYLDRVAPAADRGCPCLTGATRVVGSA